MADYEPGEMDINDQKETYEIFWAWSFRTAAIVAVVLLLMYAFLA